MPGSGLASAALAACGFIWGYFGVLLVRTELGHYAVSVGNSVILAMYGACALALVLAGRCAFHREIPRRISVALFFAALAPTIAFAWLHRSHLVCDYGEIGSAWAPLSHLPKAIGPWANPPKTKAPPAGAGLVWSSIIDSTFGKDPRLWDGEWAGVLASTEICEL